jgi:hypothetical protein
MKLKLNPYSVLLTTGILMLATVLLAQAGTSADLLKQGAKSVDKDISSLAAKALRSSDARSRAAVESGSVAGQPGTASTEAASGRMAAGDSRRVVSR